MFQRVKQQLRMKQVVEFYGVRLNRANKGECPLHREKTKGAFSIHEGKQIFNCFSCGKGGDLITFVSERFGMKPLDACKKLNEDFGLGLTNEKPSRQARIAQARENRKREKIKRLYDEYWSKLWLYIEYDMITFIPDSFYF